MAFERDADQLKEALKKAQADLEHALEYVEPPPADAIEQPQAKVGADEGMVNEEEEMNARSTYENKYGKDVMEEFDAWLASRSKKQ